MIRNSVFLRCMDHFLGVLKGQIINCVGGDPFLICSFSFLSKNIHVAPSVNLRDISLRISCALSWVQPVLPLETFCFTTVVHVLLKNFQEH